MMVSFDYQNPESLVKLVGIISCISLAHTTCFQGPSSIYGPSSSDYTQITQCYTNRSAANAIGLPQIFVGMMVFGIEIAKLTCCKKVHAYNYIRTQRLRASTTFYFVLPINCRPQSRLACERVIYLGGLTASLWRPITPKK